MLKEEKRYHDNDKIFLHCFRDEHNKLQGFYRTFYSNGNITHETFEIDSCSYGISKGFREDKRICYMQTNKFKQPLKNGVELEFIY